MRYQLASSAALLLTLLPQASSQSYFNAGRCPEPPSGNNDKKCRCINVDDFDDLKGAIERMDDNGECKCFRSFSVTKSSQESPIEVRGKGIIIQCQTLGQCAINGPVTHIFISGEDSEATISGFRFRGATESAIVISDGTGSGGTDGTREQTICDSSFVNNQNYWHNGGAIKAGAATSAYIANSYFEGNIAARMGGAVSGESNKVSVLDSTFSSNSAPVGGALSSNQVDSILILTGNSFDDSNTAGLGPAYGPAVAANGLVQDLGGNEANANDLMCLGCKLQAGVATKSYQPNLGREDDAGVSSNTNTQYKGNPEFLAYETYDKEDEWGPFHLKVSDSKIGGYVDRKNCT